MGQNRDCDWQAFRDKIWGIKAEDSIQQQITMTFQDTTKQFSDVAGEPETQSSLLIRPCPILGTLMYF